MSRNWAKTLRLPTSTFPPRIARVQQQPLIRKTTDEFYAWQQQNRPVNKDKGNNGDDTDTFVLHDGPPYANGKLHVGHALNKVLKDVTLRVQIQKGKRVHYVPGWDCHGLPIELKALSMSEKRTRHLSPVQVRRVARELATNTVVEQMEEFRSYGIMADWENRWTTMDPDYEDRQLQLFQQLVHRGLIYRRYKPVYWSPSTRTALAEAELEYNDKHESIAAFVQFPILGGESLLGDDQAPLSAVIWTTTPWTLPANQAIAVHRDLDYAIVQIGGRKERLLVAEACLDHVAKMCCNEHDHSELHVLQQGIPGARLLELDLKYTNPLQGTQAKPQPLIHADFVTADSGSGLVHIAPGHGFEDYEVCMGLGLPVPAPVDEEGRFTAEAYPDDPHRLKGLPVQGTGGAEVVSILGDAVLRTHRYRHKYPYDWRMKLPVIVRATEQWFADVAVIKEASVAATQTVQFVPTTGRSRLESFVRGRSEWCISRQRAWGVPIPALYGDDGSVVLTEESVEHIRNVVRKRGTDAWWADAPDETVWVPPSLRDNGVQYRRGTDTMDVWFDSGSSWTQLAHHRQADVYLEGSDQHRGWFQSSLLTRVAALGGGGGDEPKTDPSTLSPFKTLVTHGFLLDGKGKKMSKSLGNIVSGEQVMNGTLLPPLKKKKGRKTSKTSKGEEKPPIVPIEDRPSYDALGPDSLRLWAVGSDYTGDIVLSKPRLLDVHTQLVKYRTTFRMLLGSVHPEAPSLPLTMLDHLALLQLRRVMADVAAAYDRLEFYKGVAALNRWLAADFSAFYLEAAKDRLYCGDGGGVLLPVLFGFARMLAPLVPMLVEEAWSHAPDWLAAADSVHHPLHQLYHDPLPFLPADLELDPEAQKQLLADLPFLMHAHGSVKAAAERGRKAKKLGSSLQCSVVLQGDAAERLRPYADELATMFVVSEVRIADADEHLQSTTEHLAWRFSEPFTGRGGVEGWAWILPPNQAKCGRCWRYLAPKEDELCQRCEDHVH